MERVGGDNRVLKASLGKVDELAMEMEMEMERCLFRSVVEEDRTLTQLADDYHDRMVVA